jgi:hypothetical protein
MRDFFAKILPEITNSLKNLLKDANIDDRVKEAKLPEDCLKPFREKGKRLICLIVKYSIIGVAECAECNHT